MYKFQSLFTHLYKGHPRQRPFLKPLLCLPTVFFNLSKMFNNFDFELFQAFLQLLSRFCFYYYRQSFFTCNQLTSINIYYNYKSWSIKYFTDQMNTSKFTPINCSSSSSSSISYSKSDQLLLRYQIITYFIHCSIISIIIYTSYTIRVIKEEAGHAHT